MFSSFTIGDGGDYTTIALWQSYRRNNVPSDKEVDDELNLLSGVHSAAGFFAYWPQDEEVSIKVVIQAHPSALHNGDWDSGACLSGGTQGWKTKFNDLDVTYRDLVLKKAQVNYEQGDNYFGSIRGAGWDMSALHPGSLTFERCLIYTEGTPHTRLHYMSYVPSSSPSAFGTLDVNYNNCVLEDTIGGVYPDKATIYPAYTPTYGDHTYNFNGCTMLKQSFTNAHRITNLAPSASLTVNLSGCIEDTSGTGAGATTLIGGHPLNLNYYPGGAGFPSSLSATLTDHITNEASSTKYDWATTKTNVSYAVPFTFDGTVSSNQVGFVDNQGASSFRDYRLVADLDNLAVQYATNADLGGKDVARTHRTHDTDAGAFQSVSDRVTSYTIGSSSSVDYATWALFRTAKGLELLNGDTYNLTYESGVYSPVDNIYYNPTDSSWNVVDTTFSISGQESHNGNWDEGVIFSATTAVYPQKSFWVRSNTQTTNNNLTWNLKDIHFTNDPDNFSEYMIDNIWSCGRKVDHSYTFDRCLFSLQLPSKPIGRMNYFQNGFNYDLDSFGNIEDFGSFNLTLNNCVLESVVESGQHGGRGFDQNNGTYTGNYYLNVIGCSIKDIGNIGHGRIGNPANGVSGDSVVFRAEGNLVNMTQPNAPSTSRQDLFSNYTAFSNFSGISVDNIFSNSSSIQSWITDDTNTTYDATFTYDGSVSAGTVAHVDSGDSVSALRDYRLVADLDNLAVQYFTSNKGTFSDGHIPITYRDVTNSLRPGDADAGAFQSISTNVSSFEIGASDSGHARDGDYATIALYWAANRSQFLHGDKHILVYLEGEHSVPGQDFSNMNKVDLSLTLSGEVSHQGYWTSGSVIRLITGYPGPFRFPNNSGGLVNQSLSYGYSNLVIIQESGRFVLQAMVPYSETVSKPYVYEFTFDKCLFSGTNTFVDVYPNGLRNNNATITNSVLHLTNKTLITVGGSGTTIVRGNTIYSPQDSGGYHIYGVSAQAGVIEGNLFHVTNVRDLVNGFPNGLTLRDNICSVTSSKLFPTSGSVTGTLSIENNATNVTFNYDGTVTSGEVCYVGSGDNGDIDYRLVADADNLAVRYMDLSSVLTADVAGVSRPGSTDAGAYQSVTTDVITGTIGPADTSAEYASYSLFYNASSNDRYLNGHTLSAVLMESSGYYSHGMPQLVLYNGREVDLNFVLKGETPQNGSWDSGVLIEPGGWQGLFRIQSAGRQNITCRIEDLCITGTYPGAVIYQGAGDIVSRNIGVTNAQMETEQVYDCSLTFKNCMLSTSSNGAFAFLVVESIIDDKPGIHPKDNVNDTTTNYTANIIKNGRTDIIYDNCLMEGRSADTSIDARSSFTFGNDYFLTLKGCTLRNCNWGGNERIGSHNAFYFSAVGSLIGPTNDWLQGWGWHGEGILTRQPWWKVSDCIFAQPSGDLFYLEGYQMPAGSGTIENSIASGFITNTEFGVPFTYDGTVTSGQVGFVASSSQFKNDYKLVADLDNLAVKYMTSGELSYKDITGYKRPGGTDQRDAGAYQSISDDVNVFNIGTSSVDFTPDYTTVNLWRSSYHDYANVLNGETHLLQLRSGEEHSVETTVYLNGDADVEQTFTLSGEKPHNVDLSGSTQVTGTFHIHPYANSFTTKFKDILIDVSSSDRLTYTFNDLGSRPWTGEQQQPNHAFDFENVAVFYNASASNYTLAYAQNYGYDDGKIYATYNNCLLVAPQAPSGINGTPGSINLYTHQYGTAAQAFFEVKGCTLINAFMGNNRHTGSPWLHFSGIGNIHYVTPGILSTGGRPSGFLYVLNINQGSPSSTFDSDAIVLRDCIFNGGSNTSIARPASQDRYTIYIAEPLSGEFLFSNQTHIDGVYAASSWTYWDFENVSIRVPFNFDGTVSAGTVSFEADLSVAGTPLLDEYSGAAAAYSVRKLRSAYTGACMRIRESNFDTETDIGFDSNGDLDTAAIATHCGGGNGYVVTWYDQSGNSRDATQSTTANQPLIYNGTATLTENGKPAVEFDGSSDKLEATYTDAVDYHGIFIVVSYDSTGDINSTFSIAKSSRTKGDMLIRDNGYFVRFFTGNSDVDFVSITETTSQQLIAALWDGVVPAGPTTLPPDGTLAVYQDGMLTDDSAADDNFGATGSGIALGFDPSNNYLNGKMQECIFWNSDQSSNRIGIESNINDYYDIYS